MTHRGAIARRADSPLPASMIPAPRSIAQETYGIAPEARYW